MRLTQSIRGVVAGVLATSATVAAAAPVPDLQSCQFVLGFATMQQALGQDVVGDCVENEHHNTDNGDALQATTSGLLVWRKSDNWTAFTNGSTTWVNGPLGVQQRSNTDRFAWETNASATAQAAPVTSSSQTPLVTALLPATQSAPQPSTSTITRPSGTV